MVNGDDVSFSSDDNSLVIEFNTTEDGIRICFHRVFDDSKLGAVCESFAFELDLFDVSRLYRCLGVRLRKISQNIKHGGLS